jgi:hypothetical protein
MGPTYFRQVGANGTANNGNAMARDGTTSGQQGGRVVTRQGRLYGMINTLDRPLQAKFAWAIRY